MSILVAGTLKEAWRLKILASYHLLDTASEEAYDRITRLATQLFDVPIALVSIVDKDRIWFKSSVGVGDVRQIERYQGLCDTAMYCDDVYLIEDTRKDPVVKDSPLVTGPQGFRFYAAAPLKTADGTALGTLCIIGREPKAFDKPLQEQLKLLAAMVIDLLEQRRQLSEMTSRQQATAGIIAHELRNAISTIPGYTTLLSDQFIKPYGQQYLQHITRAVDKTNALISEMLSLSELQSPVFKLEPAAVDYARLLSHCVAGRLQSASAKDQKIYLEVPVEITVSADEQRLSQIIDNLLSNAVKYSPKSGRIDIAVSCLESEVVTTVTDEGPGFSTEDFQRIFQPFRRLSARPTGGEPSTGLGLWLVSLLAKAHGGSVEAANRSDRKGAVLTLRLPYKCEDI